MWQNSDHSFGVFANAGINIHTQSERKEANSIGYQTEFGVAYLRHYDFLSLETGLSFNNQWFVYKEENLLDSFEASYGLSITSIGLPIGLSHKFSQNKRRSFVSGGIHPSYVISARLNELESSPSDNQSLVIFPKETNPIKFSAYVRYGKAFDLTRSFMLRVEAQYQFTTVSILENTYNAHEIGLRFLFMNHN